MQITQSYSEVFLIFIAPAALVVAKNSEGERILPSESRNGALLDETLRTKHGVIELPNDGVFYDDLGAITPDSAKLKMNDGDKAKQKK